MISIPGQSGSTCDGFSRREFLRIGGMVYLSMEDNRVSVVINPVAAEAAGLKVSAKLMTLAKVHKP